MFWECVLFFITITSATAMPSNSNEVSGSYCRSHCVKEERKTKKATYCLSISGRTEYETSTQIGTVSAGFKI